MTERIKVKYDFEQKVFEYEGPIESMDTVLDRLLKSDVAMIANGAVNKKPAKQKGSNTASASPKKSTGNEPKFNSELDLVNLENFYEKLVLKSVPEHVVAFLIFLTDELGMETVTANDVYSCFYHLRKIVKEPTFPKALENTRFVAKMIMYDKGYANPRLTKSGSNHFHHKIMKRDNKS